MDVPAEILAPGPRGYRIHVVDFDASRECLYPSYAEDPGPGSDGSLTDPYAKASDQLLLGEPQFHALNAYSIAMRTVAAFERALGRRVSWGFPSHQLKIVPHAFEEANAFYSPCYAPGPLDRGLCHAASR